MAAITSITIDLYDSRVTAPVFSEVRLFGKLGFRLAEQAQTVRHRRTGILPTDMAKMISVVNAGLSVSSASPDALSNGSFNGDNQFTPIIGRYSWRVRIASKMYRIQDGPPRITIRGRAVRAYAGTIALTRRWIFDPRRIGPSNIDFSLYVPERALLVFIDGYVDTVDQSAKAPEVAERQPHLRRRHERFRPTHHRVQIAGDREAPRLDP